MNIYYCRLCGKKIDRWNYANSTYCSPYCRKKAYDIRKGRISEKKLKSLIKGVGNNKQPQIV